MLAAVTLQGNAVTLVPMEPAHIPELYVAADYEPIWTYLPYPMRSLDDMQAVVTEALEQKEEGGELPFVVKDAETGHIIGSTRYLNISERHRHLEIGWTWYTPSVWRSPVNTECKYLLLRHAFEELGCVRVQFRADERNERSNNAIRRIGATLEGVLRKERVLYSGYIRNTCVYSIIAEEWPELKARFEQQLLPGVRTSSEQAVQT
ncbi:GNAT family N-acetyltransferase [Paenibacillus koleovorans]|uniref:GNAT family N-acetyltransferase n=1 Tax=Paenibacillus koleovorans TaxID=121608 RepID=UPI000FD6D1C8|nr:GNAT family protein [Paenibacillus koleovorans]